MRSRALLLAVSLLVAGLLPVLAGPGNAADGARPAAERRPAVVERRVIGHSVRGRPIIAWRVGRPANDDKAVVFSTMHGDERDTRKLVAALVNGAEIRGIDLWLVPTYNPDGYARGTRKNARGVDLNRNFPYRWADLDGRYESGRRASSEPETRAVMQFLRDVDPKWVVSFHQPLHGVDTDTKNQALARRLADNLDLPRKRFTCGGVCHGTMTMWFNHHFDGAAITVEYGANPSRARLEERAPRQLLRALFAQYA